MVEVGWTEGGLPRCETYGPWQVAEDESHLAAVRDFMKAWRETTGQAVERAVMSLAQDPQQWLAAERGRREGA